MEFTLNSLNTWRVLVSRKGFLKKLNKRQSKKLKDRKQMLRTNRMTGTQLTQEKDLISQFNQEDVDRLLAELGVKYGK